MYIYIVSRQFIGNFFKELLILACLNRTNSFQVFLYNTNNSA